MNKVKSDRTVFVGNQLLFLGRKCQLDVMLIDLENVNLYTGRRENDFNKSLSNQDYYKLGSCVVKKEGKSLLTDKCQLKLQVDRNLDKGVCHNG